MTDPIGASPKRGRKRHTRDIEWLRARVEIDPETGCWNWTGVVNHRGYGRYHYTTDSRVINGSAHRLALELALGRPLIEDMNACHTCDNPPCCNAEHLFEGTTDDNQQDCRNKGRARWRAHEDHGMAKLKNEDIPEILAACAAGESQTSCAKRYGVSQPTISRIWNRKGWL
jgi:HNH endonuclease